MPTAAARRLRWASPFAVLAVIVGLVTIPSRLASASPPSLPPLTARQLLARLQRGHGPGPLSGTIRLTSNLGIPDLSQLAGQGGPGIDVTSLLSGSHDARVWLDGPQRARLALIDQQLAETDVIRNGADLWIWQSEGSQITHRRITSSAEKVPGGDGRPETGPVPTPDRLAASFLAKLDPTTAVSVGSPLQVAGRPAYQLLLSPRSAASTIATVAIAVDAATGLPLRVSVLAKGQARPAVQLGFTSISLARPAASTFSFSPPPGSHASANPFSIGGERRRPLGRRGEGVVPAPPVATPHATTVVGRGWAAVVMATGVSIPPGLGPVLKAATPVAGGRLLHTALVNVLVLDDGRVAAGAVRPSVLESAAAGG
jgi:outer membrane lipoprotein-sorting protein